MSGLPARIRRATALRIALVIATAFLPVAAMSPAATGQPEQHLSPAPAIAGSLGPAHEIMDPGFSWPLGPPIRIAKRFIAPSHRYGPGHRGVDLAATPGARITAPAHGIVWFAGSVAGAGVVSIRHEGGILTTYQPVATTVSMGDEIASGTVIGTVEPGHAGCEAAACLHWGARRAEDRLAYLDPLLLVGHVTVGLKPVTGSG
ncbi:M23 family metallopeptidase [Lolliginicoccus suaedae]|uniref:M23 family metallopeptidase n=1 Tax=Lolliginicoccus suaedae TaxID=2605429 RepID=UPI001F46D825|nr:M23 family metallopeptidase [Lolliginicoccus suaedae]